MVDLEFFRVVEIDPTSTPESSGTSLELVCFLQAHDGIYQNLH